MMSKQWWCARYRNKQIRLLHSFQNLFSTLVHSIPTFNPRAYTTNYSIKFSGSLFERGDKEKKSRGERTVILSRRQSKPSEMRGLQDQLFARYHPIRNRSALLAENFCKWQAWHRAPSTPSQGTHSSLFWDPRELFSDPTKFQKKMCCLSDDDERIWCNGEI